MVKQVYADYVSIFPLELLNALHSLWVFPVAVTPQVGRRPRLIFYFTWSGLSDVSKHLDPMEAMRFGGALQRILKQVLTANLRLWPVYLSNVDSEDAYIRLWLRME